MITIDGKWIDPYGADSPSLYALGRGLAGINRWGGQCSRPFSVLAHSLFVAELCPDDCKVHGLLHDVPEVVYGDIPSPWKKECDRFREWAFLERVYSSIGLPLPSGEQLKKTKEADYLAARAEATLLMPTEIQTAPSHPIKFIADGDGVLDTLLANLSIQKACDTEMLVKFWVEQVEHFLREVQA